MIIDCHGHYTTAPRPHTEWRRDQVAAFEAGVPGLYLPFWHGLWAPKATPAAVIAKLNAAATETLADPAVRKRLTDLGVEIVPREQQTPQGHRAFLKAELDKWRPIIAAANIKPAQ